MRLLITTPTALGHNLPMVPLARAIRSRGHEVRWATARDTLPWVEEAGFTAVAAGYTHHERVAELGRRFGERLQALPGPDTGARVFPLMFGEVLAPRALADLQEIVTDWRPDLVVHDAAELAAPIVAAVLGVPNVTKGFGPLLPEPRVADAAEAVAPLWRSMGLEPRPYAGCYDHRYLDVYPPGLHEEDAGHIAVRAPLRPVAYDTAAPDAVVPLPTARLDRPLVYLTMGTVFNDPAPLRSAIEALGRLDVRVLVTVGPDADPALLGPLPPHVVAAAYVPQTSALPRCDAVVSHAGSGTALGALAVGVPQLCLPQGADQFLNAAAVSRSGAGLALLPDAVSGAAIADATRRLVEEPSFREATRRVQATIAAMPSPDDVAAGLEDLV